jgi:hypothetical protein
MKKNILKDIVSVANAINRKTELEEHTRRINYHNIVRNKKKYTRKFKHKEDLLN